MFRAFIKSSSSGSGGLKAPRKRRKKKHKTMLLPSPLEVQVSAIDGDGIEVTANTSSGEYISEAENNNDSGYAEIHNNTRIDAPPSEVSIRNRKIETEKVMTGAPPKISLTKEALSLPSTDFGCLMVFVNNEHSVLEYAPDEL